MGAAAPATALGGPGSDVVAADNAAAPAARPPREPGQGRSRRSRNRRRGERGARGGDPQRSNEQRGSDAADDRGPVEHEAVDAHHEHGGGDAWEREPFTPEPRPHGEPFRAHEPAAPHSGEGNGAGSDRYDAEPAAPRERDFGEHSSGDRFDRGEPAAAPPATETERTSG
jgi:hypothetical protein